MADFQGLARYGLTNNPFEFTTLPMTPDDQKFEEFQVTTVLELDDIDELIERAVAARKACFFLLAGRDGSGRTSAAHYILERYRRLRNVPRERFVVPDWAESSNSHGLITRWFKQLRNDLGSLPLRLPDDLIAEIKELARAGEEAGWQEDCQGLAYRISMDTGADANRPAAFGVRISNLREPTLLRDCLRVFATAQTVVILTVQDYDEIGRSVSAEFESNNRRRSEFERTVTLPLFKGEAIAEFAGRVWTGNAPLPFANGAFGTHLDWEETIARVLNLLSAVIEHKIKEHPVGPAWPDDRKLEVTAVQLQGYLDLAKKLKP